ncbi:MAG TPA: outer membrane beta-barrel protein, partial [Flavitalea sp.]|nr:outer membrane beta-barrel protein [Flavitalea sp.]
ILAQKVQPFAIGIVVSENNKVAVEGATVWLYNAQDTMNVRKQATVADGSTKFSSLNPGRYYFRIDALGFESYTSLPLSVDERNRNLFRQVILIKSVSSSLAEVVITAKKPFVVQEPDKTIINVESMLGSPAYNALEILEKTPGISIASNGDISLNGKTGVMLLINGRTVYMSGTDLMAYLKSLPGGQLDKLELMDNPPARYDAGGSAIINIKLKRNRVAGLTGNLSSNYSQGFYARTYNSLNLNYQTKKLNFSGTLGYNNETARYRETNQRSILSNDLLPSSFQQISNFQKVMGNTFQMRTALDYNPSSRTTYGLMFNTWYDPRNTLFGSTVISYDANWRPDSSGTGFGRVRDRRYNIEGSFNILHQLKKGSEFSGDVSYLKFWSNGHQLLNNTTFIPDGSQKTEENFAYDLPGFVKILTGNADYSHGKDKETGWEAGLKSNFIDNDNDSRYYSMAGEISETDFGRSNHFIYKENINSAYLMGRHNLRRYSFRAGIRLENTNIQGTLVENPAYPSENFTKNYTGLFPSFYVSRKMDSAGKKTLGFSIARRVRRPNYQQLNPFIFYRDNFSYATGNPQLNPQYQYSFELKYQHGQKLGTGLSYGYFNDVIFSTARPEGNIFITAPGNVAKGSLLMLNINASLSFTSWWKFNFNTTAGRMKINTKNNKDVQSTQLYTARFNLINQFSLPDNWLAELTAMYQGKQLNGQQTTDPRFTSTAAVQKKIWKNKATV